MRNGSEWRPDSQFPLRGCTSTPFRPPSATTFIMTRILPLLKHTWHEYSGRKPPYLLLLVQCPTNWPYVRTSSSLPIPSSVIIAHISTCARQAGLPLTLVLRPSRLSRPMACDHFFAVGPNTN